jgi:hypothetical protein
MLRNTNTISVYELSKKQFRTLIAGRRHVATTFRSWMSMDVLALAKNIISAKAGCNQRN